MSFEIYTDGGCHGNPGPGGWAYRVIAPDGSVALEHSGAVASTTNNRMELTAVIEALVGFSRTDVEVGIVTDSQYVRQGITSWIHAWRKNGWLTSAKKPVKNRDLWQRLDELNERVQPSWRWVRGHAGNAHNEACDAAVQRAIRSLPRS